MASRRQCLQLAGCTALFPLLTANVCAGQAKKTWSSTAFAAAESVRRALVRHPFLTDAFAGTLEKSVFAAYLCQNILYLENYARCLEQLSERLSQLPDFASDAKNLATWAQETKDLRAWTIEYAASFTGKPIRPEEIVALPELLTYEALETRHLNHSNPAFAMAALLPCFWTWDEFGRALRPTARLQGNPFKDWVAGMGSDAAAASAREAVDLTDRLSSRLSSTEQNLMTDIFAAGCWMEWQLFAAVLRPVTAN